MNPSRELDALVAEKVMGWKWEDDRLTIEGHYKDENGEYHSSFFPSTDIAAAWEVVEKFDRYEIVKTELPLPTGEVWKPHVVLSHWKKDSFGTAFGDTVPHAICLAALKAIGVEI